MKARPFLFYLITFCLVAVIGLVITTYNKHRKNQLPIVKAMDALSSDKEKDLLMSKLLHEALSPKKHGEYGVAHWKEHYSAFATLMIKKARDQRLDSVSLGKILDKIPEGKDAYLPIAAYQTMLSGNPIWIVVVKRANGSQGEMDHGEVHAYECNTLQSVGCVTCF